MNAIVVSGLNAVIEETAVERNAEIGPGHSEKPMVIMKYVIGMPVVIIGHMACNRS